MRFGGGSNSLRPQCITLACLFRCFHWILFGDDVGCGPMGGLSVEVGGDGDCACGWLYVYVEAVDQEQGCVVREVFCGGLNREGAGFAGDQRDVVVGVEDRQDAFAGLLLVELQVGHQGDGVGGVLQRDGEECIAAVDV